MQSQNVVNNLRAKLPQVKNAAMPEVDESLTPEAIAEKFDSFAGDGIEVFQYFHSLNASHPESVWPLLHQAIERDFDTAVLNSMISRISSTNSNAYVTLITHAANAAAPAEVVSILISAASKHLSNRQLNELPSLYEGLDGSITPEIMSKMIVDTQLDAMFDIQPSVRCA
ncbi:hypothetical protein [Neptuniibacter sp. QD37_11]|uniref:hypothetical protein n=1 Tax=Neptuniibacter sp. QD37_11 TaxID=3398209 RepID=UPI0039F50C53